MKLKKIKSKAELSDSGKWDGYLIDADEKMSRRIVESLSQRDDSGEPKQKNFEGVWMDDELVGTSTKWYENGQKQYSEIYNNGEVILAKCWDKKGNAQDCNYMWKLWGQELLEELKKIDEIKD